MAWWTPRHIHNLPVGGEIALRFQPHQQGIEGAGLDARLPAKIIAVTSGGASIGERLENAPGCGRKGSLTGHFPINLPM